MEILDFISFFLCHALTAGHDVIFCIGEALEKVIEAECKALRDDKVPEPRPRLHVRGQETDAVTLQEMASRNLELHVANAAMLADGCDLSIAADCSRKGKKQRRSECASAQELGGLTSLATATVTEGAGGYRLAVTE